MEYSYNLQRLLVCVSAILCACAGNFIQTETSTFSAVSAFRGLTRLYLRMKIREPHLQPDAETDVFTKDYICQSIVESAYFDMQYEEDAVDMDDVYADLTTRMDSEMEDLPPSRALAQVIQDYENGSFTFRTRLTRFYTDGGDREEFAFACATKDQGSDGSMNVYYISDPYNIRMALDRPTNGATYARFVCMLIALRCQLVALAEEPAHVYPGLGYESLGALESIYRQMRQFYTRAPKESDDPLCGLTRSEKLRVCASVLNAVYFNYKVEFNPDQTKFEGKCALQRVSFFIVDIEGAEEDVSDKGASTSNKRRRADEEDIDYREWMLFCPVDPIIYDQAPRVPTKMYYLFRAYHSHHVFVGFHNSWTGEYHIEAICGNIAVLIDHDGGWETSDDMQNEVVPPNLIGLLETQYAALILAR